MTNDAPEHLPLTVGPEGAVTLAPDPTLPRHPNAGRAAASLAEICRVYAKELTAADMLDTLRSALKNDSDGQAMLFSQAQVLDTLFHRLTIRAMSGTDGQGEPIHDYVNEETTKLALRAQKLCRTTVESMNILQARKKRIADTRHEDMFKEYNKLF